MTLSARLLQDMRDRTTRIAAGGGAEKASARHELGQLTARERLALLFQEGTFQEIGMHIRSTRQAGVSEQKDVPADAVDAPALVPCDAVELPALKAPPLEAPGCDDRPPEVQPAPIATSHTHSALERRPTPLD